MHRFYVIGGFRFLLILAALYLAIYANAAGMIAAAFILTLMTPPVKI